MAINFEEVCQILKESVSFVNPPDYEINPDFTCDSKALMKKITFHYQKWTSRVKRNIGEQDFRCVGCCEIGNLTGSELMKMFFDIFETKQFETGNYVCFLKNSEQCAALLFEPYRPVIITLSPPKNSGCNSAYSKLFDDDKVDKDRKKGVKNNVSEEEVAKVRQQAKVEYPTFWQTKFSVFDLYPFGVAFFGLAADIARHSCTKYSFQRFSADVGKVPFAACVKLAFDANLTGEVTNLFGEVRFVGWLSEEKLISRKVDLICTTAHQLISRLVAYYKFYSKKFCTILEFFLFLFKHFIF